MLHTAHHRLLKLSHWVAAGALVALLSACGGGGGDAGPLASTLPGSLPPGGTPTVNLPGSGSPTAVTITATGPARAIAGVVYTYSASASNGASITWAWGDGSANSVGNSVKKQWSKPGTYTATASGQALATAGVVVTGAPLSISTAGGHTCALKPNGTVSCWGENFAGQLGNGLLVDSGTPVTVTGVSSAVAVAAGNGYSCAHNANGTVSCWGQGFFGQLGNNSTNASTVSVAVNGLTDTVALSVGGSHACALRAAGRVSCWGANGSGQLGNGNTTQSTVPVAVVGLTDATSIAAGANQSCAVRTGGSVVCWGSNFFGQLGNNDFGDPSVTTTQVVSGLSDAVALALGGDHSCALRATGSVVCWGGNFTGQLGNNTITQSITPSAVQGLTDAVAISAGASQTCALRSSGAMACWGNNAAGRLGDGSASATARVPVAVSSLADGSYITTGAAHTCALRSTGAVSCWGDNSGGQIGKGTTTGTFNVPQDTLPGPVYWK